MKNKIKTLIKGVLAFLVLFAAAQAVLIYKDYRAERAFLETEPVGEAFNFDILTAKAEKLAHLPYAAPDNDLPEDLKNLDYDGYRPSALNAKPDLGTVFTNLLKSSFFTRELCSKIPCVSTRLFTARRFL